MVLNDQYRKHTVNISPVGVLEYARLDNPQPPNPENPHGTPCRVTLAMNPNDQAVREWCSAIESFAPGGKLPFHTDKESGMIVVKFAAMYQPKLVDANRTPLPDNITLGRGSQVKAAYVPAPYDDRGGGVNLYLHGVQVLELVKPESKSLPFAEKDGCVRESTGGGDATQDDSLPC